MIGFITLGTNDLPRAAAFYDALLPLLGARRSSESARYVGWSSAQGAPMLLAIVPHDGQRATPGNGTMVALQAGRIVRVPLSEAVGELKLVDPDLYDVAQVFFE